MAKKKAVPATEAGLLAAIREAPEHDAPRLVYADWLDEHDRPERAEFIRVQCRLATAGPSDPAWAELYWREGQLLSEANRKKWGELPVMPVKLKEFHRGFVDDLSLHASVFL